MGKAIKKKMKEGVLKKRDDIFVVAKVKHFSIANTVCVFIAVQFKQYVDVPTIHAITAKSSRDRSRWCHLSIIPGTTPLCLVSTEGNVSCLGTRNLA